MTSHLANPLWQDFHTAPTLHFVTKALFVHDSGACINNRAVLNPFLLFAGGTIPFV